MEVVQSVQAHFVLLHLMFSLMHKRNLWSAKSDAAMQMADLTAGAWNHNLTPYV